MTNYAIAAILFILAAIIWISTQPPDVQPMRLVTPREVSMEEYRRGATPPATSGRNLPTFATEEGGRALTEAEMQQWRSARAADPAYQDAVRRMQDRRRWLASTGNLTAFDSGRCTLAQSAEKCREARARMEQSAGQWLRDSRAARERGEP